MINGRVWSVMADGDSFVAVGSRADGAPAAWTSADGWSWHEHAVPEPNAEIRDIDPSGYLGSTMGGLVKWGDTIFSFGTLIGPADGRGVVAWRSHDGATWEVIESTSALFTRGYAITGVVAADDGLLALEHGFAWPSGRTWRWRPETSWVAGWNGDGRVSLHNAAWDGSRFVMIGSLFCDDYAEMGGIWTSVDGDAWTDVTPPQAHDLRMDYVIAMPGGGFIVRGSGADAVVAWRSDDGRSWSRMTLPEDAGSAAGNLMTLGQQLVATYVGDDHARAWLSHDGLTWSGPFVWPLSNPGPAAANEDGTIVMFGAGPGSPDGEPATILIRGRPR